MFHGEAPLPSRASATPRRLPGPDLGAGQRPALERRRAAQRGAFHPAPQRQLVVDHGSMLGRAVVQIRKSPGAQR